MENFKFWLSTFLVFVLLGSLGYFAFTSIDSGSQHVDRQKIKKLESENQDLKEQLAELEKNLEKYEPKIEEQSSAEETSTESVQTTKPAVSNSYKYEKIIEELQELISENIQMKLKSHGTRVGTVQNFLNLYNNTSNKVDNDYGETTKRAVSAFQKAVGLNANGEAGPSTFTKMIEWLKKQG